MYILSHWMTAVGTGLWDHETLAAGAALPLALPDITGHHSWSYRECRWSHPLSSSGRLFRTHFLGDWFIHYGPSAAPIKRGWAYRHAGVFSRRYAAFFAATAWEGLRDAGPPRDSVRGFSHTMVEYALDLFLARRPEAQGVLVALKSIMRDIGDPVPLLAREGADHDAAVARDEARRYQKRVAAAQAPEDLAIAAGVEKFGLRACAASTAFLRQELAEGLAQIDKDEIGAALTATSAFIVAGLAANQRAVAGNLGRVALWT